MDIVEIGVNRIDMWETAVCVERGGKGYDGHQTGWVVDQQGYGRQSFCLVETGNRTFWVSGIEMQFHPSSLGGFPQ